MKRHLLLCVAVACMCMMSGLATAQRQMENLNRGLVAFNQSGKVYLSWRLLATDVSGTGFNVYRSAGGATAVKLNSSVITATTDYTDAAFNTAVANVYHVVPVINGIEQTASEKYTLAANSAVNQYIPINLAAISDGTYSVQHVYVGDVDGDGDYDYIVKRFLESTTDRKIVLDCYLNTGTLKWRMYMGRNVETGNSTMSSPVLVYDFNGDGKAEVLLKTGEGTTFGNGTSIGDTNGDGVTDYNTHVYSDMYQVTKDNCPEFLSLVNGSTGAEMARTNFIARGAKSTWASWWGDTYGHRMNFIQAAVAYVDGVTPSAVFSRGPGDKMDVVAWNLSTGSFVQDWSWTSRGKTFTSGTGWTDFHQIKCVDVDSDGKDEISWGSSMLDHNGTVKYTTALVHGDRFQIGDFNPNRAGLEGYAIQQNNSTLLGAALFDANTGAFINTWYTSAVADIGRGDVADIDPNTVGMELFSLASSGLQSCTGATIASARQYPDLSIWWDGDLCRESFIGVGSSGYNPAISKWNPATLVSDRKFSIYNDGGSYAVTCPYAGRAPFIGDILGDWREEVILETSDRSQLRIYSTVNTASTRIYALMQNPAYRIDVCTKGYLCSKYPDYYLGTGMSTPAKPNITFPVANGTYKLIAKHSGKAVDVANCGTADGVNVQQWTDLGNTCQQWIVSNDGNGAYTLKNVNSSKVLDVNACGTANKTNVQLWTGLGNNCQKWTLIADGGGYYQVKNVNSGKCLDVVNALTTDGANIQQYTCNGADCQKFLFTTQLKGATLDAEECIQESSAIGNGLNISPNPVDGSTTQLSMELQEASEVNVVVVDYFGKVVFRQNLGEREAGAITESLDLSALPKGVYIVTVQTNSGAKSTKLIRL